MLAGLYGLLHRVLSTIYQMVYDADMRKSNTVPQFNRTIRHSLRTFFQFSAQSNLNS